VRAYQHSVSEWSESVVGVGRPRQPSAALAGRQPSEQWLRSAPGPTDLQPTEAASFQWEWPTEAAE